MQILWFEFEVWLESHLAKVVWYGSLAHEDAMGEGPQSPAQGGEGGGRGGGLLLPPRKP